MSTRPRARVTTSSGPTAIDGAACVDRYLKALDGSIVIGAAVFDALEREFVTVAKRFAACRGISYEAWRDVGVPEHVLQRAEIALEVAVG